MYVFLQFQNSLGDKNMQCKIKSVIPKASVKNEIYENLFRSFRFFRLFREAYIKKRVVNHGDSIFEQPQ